MPSKNIYIIEKYKSIILNNILNYYPEFTGINVVINGEPLGGQFANTFRFTIIGNNYHKTIYLKLCPLYETLDPAKLEFQTLNVLFNDVFSKQSAYAVARPIDYFSDDNAYLQESVGENNLREFLLTNNSVFASDSQIRDMQFFISGSAKWLSMFHSNTLADHGEFFLSAEYLSGIEGEFDYRALRKFNFSKELLDQMDSLFEMINFFDKKIKIPCAKWHWDYTPGHVYIDKRKISVIDILGKDNVPIYEDIGHFLASLTCINNLPGHLFFSHKRSQGLLCDHFVKNYLDESQIEENEAMFFINLYKIKYLITYFLNQYNQVSGRSNKYIGMLFANYRLVRLINRSLTKSVRDAFFYKDKLTFI